MPRKKQDKTGGSFEDLMARIEAIVRDLETGELGIENAMAKYEEGVLALAACRRILDEAEKKIEMMVAGGDGSLESQPFDPKAAEARKDDGAAPEKGRGRAGGKDEVEGLLF